MDIKVKPTSILGSAVKIQGLGAEIRLSAESVRNVAGAIGNGSEAYSVIAGNLRVYGDVLEQLAAGAASMHRNLAQISAKYQQTEKSITDSAGLIRFGEAARNAMKNGGLGGVVAGGIKGAGGGGGGSDEDKDRWKIGGAVSVGTTGGSLGILSYSGKNEFLTGEVSGKIKSEWDIKNGDAGISAEIGASGAVAKQSIEVGAGPVTAGVELTELTAGVKGSVEATLFKDGKLDPKIAAKVKAEATAAKGEAKLEVGNKRNNVHGSAEGKLGTASAEAEIGIGKDGVKAKAGAEAYAATGEAKVGFTLFGIKVDASVEGKAGGAGVTVGGEATSGGVEGEIGAGLGLGGGIKIKIDWTQFKPPKIKLPKLW